MSFNATLRPFNIANLIGPFETHTLVIPSLLLLQSTSSSSSSSSSSENKVNKMEKKIKDENEIIEIRSSESGTTESLCSFCEFEMSGITKDNEKINVVVAEVHNEPEDDMLDDLLKASKSLSQISVQEEDALDFHVDQETLFDLENAANSSKNEGLSKDSSSAELVSAGTLKVYSSAMNDLIKGSKIGAEKNSPIDLLDDTDEDSDFVLRISSLHQDTQQSVAAEPQVAEIDESPPKKRSKLTDKIVSTETTRATSLNNYWDADFPPETELKKLDVSICHLTQHNLEKSINSRCEEEETLPIFPVDTKEITETLKNRKRLIHDLVNNVYKASRYLDDVRKILAAAPSSGPVIIPPPPKPQGYDKQFDFPERNRFSKLPITIESARGSKVGDDAKEKSCLKPQSNFSSTLGKSRKNITNKSSSSGGVTSLKQSMKSINNRIEISLPNRFKKQQSIKGTFSGGNKENQGLVNNNNSGGLTNNSFEKDSLSDDGSMYEFNPLIRARKSTK